MQTQASHSVPLFTASRSFWVCHIGGVLLQFSFALVLWFVFGFKEGFSVSMLGNTLWLCAFFIGGLYVRQRNIVYRRLDLPNSTIIVKNVGLVLAVSVMAVAFMCVIMLPIHYDEIIRLQRLQAPSQSPEHIIWAFLFGNFVQSTLYFVCWVAVYLGITNSRRAHQTRIDNLQLQNSLKEARLSSLANQLNPHFLFNALNNIRFMITEDAKQAENMLMSLSAVLRYSLESSKQETVMLSQELDITQRYLDLVKIQFEDRLRLSMRVDDGLQSVMVPPMMLQMLLENAVKHGIERMQFGGDVDVSIVKESDMMKVSVSNSMPDSPSVSAANDTNGESGIGLRNIDQRLQLLYGPAAGLYTDVNDHKFHTRVVVPLEQAQ
ncbi:hypothetical protein GCM10008090_03850 [Arenicella chitinivorans]|uniref:Signal transduction histidine kinase internal region domain-containing protein n=1 Tax=Arenicella chitinivorans TaxID=1329800 RepID=A0A918RFY2_9GAMM|nr:histidine kinase [Arenicella chitinivorans]GGZ98575.1 hypothetical protein GCM10008090_03850 [Arenicella chitinivorans]